MSYQGRQTAQKPASDDFDRRMSIVSGPRVRRYEAVTWDDAADRMSAASTVSDLSVKLKEAVRVKCGTREKAVTVPSSWKGQKIGSFKDSSISDPGLASSTSSASIASTAVTTSSIDSYIHLRTPLSGSQQGLSELSSCNDHRLVLAPTDTKPWQGGHSPLLEPFDDRDKTPTKSPKAQLPTVTGYPASRSVHSAPHSKLPNKLHSFADTPTPPLASPNFTLISLAEAQERERARSRQMSAEFCKSRTTPLPPSSVSSSPVTHPTTTGRTPKSMHVKGRKSGFLRLMNKTPKSPLPSLLISSPVSPIDPPSRPFEASNKLHDMVQTSPVTSPAATRGERGLRPHLELRPVSVNFANGLPIQYLSSNKVPSPPLVSPPHLITTAESVQSPQTRHDADDVRPPRSEAGDRITELEEQVERLEALLLLQVRSRDSRPSQCSHCGHSSPERAEIEKRAKSIMDRGRAKTGRGTRGVFGTGGYEREPM